MEGGSACDFHFDGGFFFTWVFLNGEIGAITKLGHLGNPLKFPLVRSRAVVVIVVVGGPFEHLPNGIL